MIILIHILNRKSDYARLKRVHLVYKSQFDLFGLFSRIAPLALRGLLEFLG